MKGAPSLQIKDRWESSINFWFPFLYSQKWNCAASLFPKQNYNSYNHVSVRDLFFYLFISIDLRRGSLGGNHCSKIWADRTQSQYFCTTHECKFLYKITNFLITTLKSLFCFRCTLCREQTEGRRPRQQTGIVSFLPVCVLTKPFFTPFYSLPPPPPRSRSRLHVMKEGLTKGWWGQATNKGTATFHKVHLRKILNFYIFRFKNA